MTIPSAAAPPGPPAGLCVLVVEDDEADAYLIGRALAGHPSVRTVVLAPDGVEALRMVDQGEVEPDVAFIDLHMPRKNGFNLLTALACDSERSFPMVVLTSSAAPTDAIRSRLRGAIRVATKPDSVEAMQTVLSSAIDAVCPRRLPPPGAPGATPRFSTSDERQAARRPRSTLTAIGRPTPDEQPDAPSG